LALHKLAEKLNFVAGIRMQCDKTNYDALQLLWVALLLQSAVATGSIVFVRVFSLLPR